MMQEKGRSLINVMKNTALVVLGTVLIAFGTSVFLVPFDLVAGGISGIAIVLAKIPGPSFLTEGFYVAVMTWGFFILGLFLLGRAFAAKTLCSTLVYPPAFSLFSYLASDEMLDGLFYIRNTAYTDAAPIVASVFGGIVIGVGVALAFLGGGSTGGVDIIALAVSGRFKKITSAKVLLILDAAVILTGALVIGDTVVSLLGVISAFVSSVMVDRIFGGAERAFSANIISDKYEQINRAVIEKMNRTTTVIPCVGGYSGERKNMLSVSFNMSQYSELLALVLGIDKNAFITVIKAHEINGEGWTRR